jgi:hypothetical protein
MNNIDVTIAHMQDDIKHTADTVDRVEKKLDAFIASSEKHFAAKWVEKLLVWFLFTIAGLVIMYVFYVFVVATGSRFNPFQ